MLRVLDIVSGTSVDGPGLRTSIYFAGCKHACPGCHNPQSHDPNAGTAMSVEQILENILPNDENITFSGGDPLFQPSEELVKLAKAIKNAGHTIWCYTGFRYEQVATHPLLGLIEVLVDGPFVESQRDNSLLFRGSSNQRLIHIPYSSPTSPQIWMPDF